jgi:hypothetical protein
VFEHPRKNAQEKSQKVQIGIAKDGNEPQKEIKIGAIPRSLFLE